MRRDVNPQEWLGSLYKYLAAYVASLPVHRTVSAADNDVWDFLRQVGVSLPHHGARVRFSEVMNAQFQTVRSAHRRRESALADQCQVAALVFRLLSAVCRKLQRPDLMTWDAFRQHISHLRAS